MINLFWRVLKLVTWEALESNSVPWYRATWRVKDFDLVW